MNVVLRSEKRHNEKGGDRKAVCTASPLQRTLHEKTAKRRRAYVCVGACACV